MNETLLAVLGFATIIMVIVLLLRNVTVAALAFVGVSTVTAANSGADRNIYDFRGWRFYQSGRGGYLVHGMSVSLLRSVFWNYDGCGNVRQDHQCTGQKSWK